MFPTGQYIKRESFLHALDPRTKLLILLLSAILILSRASWSNHIVALFALILLTILSKVGFKKILMLIWTFRIFAMITFLIHAFFTRKGDPIFQWGIVHISDIGIENGMLFSMRIMLLFWAAAIFGWTTSPIALADAMEKIFSFVRIFKIPPRDISMIVLLSMRYVPTMMDDAQKIRWAQLARGYEISRKGIFRNIRNIVPAIIPLFIAAFRRADKLALALEMRGYDPNMPRTRLDENIFSWKDWLTCGLLLAATVIIVIFLI